MTRRALVLVTTVATMLLLALPAGATEATEADAGSTVTGSATGLAYAAVAGLVLAVLLYLDAYRDDSGVSRGLHTDH